MFLRFMNKDDCENACRHMKIKKASEEVCSLFVEDGSCTQEHNQTKPKWGYSQKDSRNLNLKVLTNKKYILQTQSIKKRNKEIIRSFYFILILMGACVQKTAIG